MKALIDPRQTVSYISGWVGNPQKAIFETYPNSCRVCQVEDDNQTFGVGEPLFWTDCPSDIVSDQWYYDSVTLQFIAVSEIPIKLNLAALDQPLSIGTTTI